MCKRAQFEVCCHNLLILLGVRVLLRLDAKDSILLSSFANVAGNCSLHGSVLCSALYAHSSLPRGARDRAIPAFFLQTNPPSRVLNTRAEPRIPERQDRKNMPKILRHKRVTDHGLYRELREVSSSKMDLLDSLLLQ
jgi:hypothetical protein